MEMETTYLKKMEINSVVISCNKDEGILHSRTLKL